MGTPISSLPLASTPTGTEYVPIVQSGTTKRTTVLEVAQTLLPITTNEISDANVTADKLAINSVTTVKIVDANVTAAKLATDAVTTVKILNANVTAAKLDGQQSGSAPIFGARAWVNFNGAGTTGANQTIRGQGNVASVYKNGTGDYTVTFTTALPDGNYAVSGTVQRQSGGDALAPVIKFGTTPSTTTFNIYTMGASGTPIDPSIVSIVVFR